MTNTPEAPDSPEPAAAANYLVVLLVEQPLSDQDATQVRSLHETIEEPVRYHVLMPVDDAAARVEASLGSLSGGELLASRRSRSTPAAAPSRSCTTPSPPWSAREPWSVTAPWSADLPLTSSPPRSPPSAVARRSC